MKRLIALIVVLALFSQPALAQEEVTVTVSVTDTSGDPVRGAELTASWDDGSATETTASNGKAFVDVPADQEITIEVEHEDYVRNRPYRIDSSRESTVEIDVHPKASAAIQVSDSHGTVDDASVVVRKHGKIAATGATNENGVFETGVIEEGNYTASISKPGYYRKQIDVRAEGNVEESVTIEQGSVTVSFNVTDDHFQEPKAVESAEVHVADIGSIKVRENGQAAMNLPVNSKLGLTVTKEGYDEVHREVTIDEQSRTIDFTLERTPGVFIETVNRKVVAGERSRVAVTNSYDEPVEGAAVSLDGDTVGETDENGVFMVPVETEGNHTITATKDALESESVTVQAFSTESEKQQERDEEADEQRNSVSIVDLGIQLIKRAVGKLVGVLG